MNIKLKLYISLLICFVTFSFNAQEPALKASVNKNELSVNQRLRIKFSTNKQNADNFKAPNFLNFKVISGPSQSVTHSSVNNKITVSKSYSYIIQPKQEGEFNIPAASIDIEGKSVLSNTIKIIVLNPVHTPKNNNNVNYIANQNVHLVAELSKTKPYVGESINLKYVLYISDKVKIHDSPIIHIPKYKGFWSKQINKKKFQTKKENFYGKHYQGFVLHETLLIPTKDGPLTIPPFNANVTILVQTDLIDLFEKTTTRKVKKQLYSPQKIVYVKKLPIKNKPTNFSGAVGQFTINTTLYKYNLKNTEIPQVKFTINGEGNLELFELPKIKNPKRVGINYLYKKEKIIVNSNNLKGKITAIYTIIPQQKGKYKIPKINFSYFNPKEEKYKTITSDDLSVDILDVKKSTKNDNSNKKKANP